MLNGFITEARGPAYYADATVFRVIATLQIDRGLFHASNKQTAGITHASAIRSIAEGYYTVQWYQMATGPNVKNVPIQNFNIFSLGYAKLNVNVLQTWCIGTRMLLDKFVRLSSDVGAKFLSSTARAADNKKVSIKRMLDVREDGLRTDLLVSDQSYDSDYEVSAHHDANGKPN